MDEIILREFLTQNGYTWVYKKRTREKLDGCLTAFKTDRFELIESKYLEYYVDGNETLLNRDNVG